MDKQVCYPYNGVLLDNKIYSELIHAIIWMNFEKIYKVKEARMVYYMIPFIWKVYNRQAYRDNKYISGYIGLEEAYGIGDWWLRSERFLFGNNENVQNL